MSNNLKNNQPSPGVKVSPYSKTKGQGLAPAPKRFAGRCTAKPHTRVRCGDSKSKS